MPNGQERKVVHKSLEHETGIVLLSCKPYACDVFGRGAALVTGIAEFVPFGIVLESERKKRLPVYTVIHFLHIVRCHFGRNAPAFQIIDECRML